MLNILLQQIVLVTVAIFLVSCSSSGGGGVDCKDPELCGNYNMFSYDPFTGIYGMYDVTLGESVRFEAVAPISPDLEITDQTMIYGLDSETGAFTLDEKEVGAFSAAGDVVVFNTAMPNNTPGISFMFEKGTDMRSSEIDGDFLCGGVMNTGLFFPNDDLPNSSKISIKYLGEGLQKVRIELFPQLGLGHMQATAKNIVRVTPEGRLSVVFLQLTNGAAASIDGYVHPSGNVMALQFSNFLGLAPFAVVCIKGSDSRPDFSGDYLQVQTLTPIGTENHRSALATTHVDSEKTFSISEYLVYNGSPAPTSSGRYTLAENGFLSVSPLTVEGAVSPDGRFYYITDINIIDLTYAWSFGIRR